MATHILVDRPHMNGQLIFPLCSEITTFAHVRLFPGVVIAVNDECLPIATPLAADLANVRFNMSGLFVFVAKAIAIESFVAVSAGKLLLLVGHMDRIMVLFDRVVRREGPLADFAAVDGAMEVLSLFLIGYRFPR